MAIASGHHIEVHDDKIVIVGTRITIEDIVAMYVINESPIDWITEEFGLTYAQIYAALSYYYDHKEAVDRAMDETEALASKIGLNSQAHLVQIRARQSNS